MLDLIHKLGLTVKYVRSHELDILRQSNEIFDVILVLPQLDRSAKGKPFKFHREEHFEYLSKIYEWLDASHSHLDKYGSMLVYDIPQWLPYFAEHLHSRMIFKYWITIKNPTSRIGTIFPSFHEGVILFVNHKTSFTLNTVRYPHIFCSHCKDYLADWGGKKHLRHSYGPVISDVWDDREDFIDDMHGLAPHTLARFLELTCKSDFRVLLAAYDGEPYPGTIPLDLNGEINTSEKVDAVSTNERKIERVSIQISKSSQQFPFEKDRIFIGDTIEIMSSWIDDENTRFDLIFADPPYNLEKDYGKLDDALEEQEYVQWCDRWLDLCSQLLKPEGSLYVLNLPKWTYFHATRLNERLFFQHWIAWDALSEPRGRVMPAHYGLLLYTKHPTNFTYNPLPKIPKPDLCLRSKCINSRPLTTLKEEISDVWYDVHRIKHKRDRDAHPCQLPVKLLERVILISSNPGDTVFDPFMGTGTSAIVAKKFGRHYVGTEVDPMYHVVAERKLLKVENQKWESHKPIEMKDQKTDDEKYETVIKKNTFFFYNHTFEQINESYLNSVKETLLTLKNDIENNGLQKSIFEDLLTKKENGLTAILSLTGVSIESLKRIITLIRIVNDAELNGLVYKDKWCEEVILDDISEWDSDKVTKLVRTDKFFRSGLVNLFFEGATVPFLTETIPLFELKKFSISKMKFDTSEMIDTLVRYKEKGSYSAKTEKNAEKLISALLEQLNIAFEKGDLSKLRKHAVSKKRTMDFLIPNEKDPIIIVESSYLVTTSSGQGDKSKTEIAVNSLIKQHYPKAKFIGFVDGIGWYVRKRDLKRMVEAYDDVFTFHKDEMTRFRKMLLESNVPQKSQMRLFDPD